jgi:hypothetical protein
MAGFSALSFSALLHKKCSSLNLHVWAEHGWVFHLDGACQGVLVLNASDELSLQALLVGQRAPRRTAPTQHKHILYFYIHKTLQRCGWFFRFGTQYTKNTFYIFTLTSDRNGVAGFFRFGTQYFLPA